MCFMDSGPWNAPLPVFCRVQTGDLQNGAWTPKVSRTPKMGRGLFVLFHHWLWLQPIVIDLHFKITLYILNIVSSYLKQKMLYKSIFSAAAVIPFSFSRREQNEVIFLNRLKSTNRDSPKPDNWSIHSNKYQLDLEQADHLERVYIRVVFNHAPSHYPVREQRGSKAWDRPWNASWRHSWRTCILYVPCRSTVAVETEHWRLTP